MGSAGRVAVVARGKWLWSDSTTGGRPHPGRLSPPSRSRDNLLSIVNVRQRRSLGRVRQSHSAHGMIDDVIIRKIEGRALSDMMRSKRYQAPSHGVPVGAV